MVRFLVGMIVLEHLREGTLGLSDGMSCLHAFRLPLPLARELIHALGYSQSGPLVSAPG